MNTVECAYTKISPVHSGSGAEIAYNWQPVFGSMQLVQTANAAGNVAPLTTPKTLGQQLTIPFYLLIISFFLFILLMSIVYTYHWLKFGLRNPQIRSFIPVYFIVLITFSIPIFFNLLF